MDRLGDKKRSDSRCPRIDWMAKERIVLRTDVRVQRQMTFPCNVLEKPMSEYWFILFEENETFQN